MTRISSAIAAALIASASFGTAALAEGDYFQGVQKTASASLDHTSTGSIAQKSDAQKADGQTDLNTGDYFSGANRPN